MNVLFNLVLTYYTLYFILNFILNRYLSVLEYSLRSPTSFQEDILYFNNYQKIAFQYFRYN